MPKVVEELTFVEWLRRKAKQTEDIGDANDFAEAADTILSLKSALTRIAEAACYHTRTTGERVCPAEQTRDIARAALSGSPAKPPISPSASGVGPPATV